MVEALRATSQERVTEDRAMGSLGTTENKTTVISQNKTTAITQNKAKAITQNKTMGDSKENSKLTTKTTAIIIT
jgi:hypothetical protein